MARMSSASQSTDPAHAAQSMVHKSYAVTLLDYFLVQCTNPQPWLIVCHCMLIVGRWLLIILCRPVQANHGSWGACTQMQNCQAQDHRFITRKHLSHNQSVSSIQTPRLSNKHQLLLFATAIQALTYQHLLYS